MADDDDRRRGTRAGVRTVSRARGRGGAAAGVARPGACVRCTLRYRRGAVRQLRDGRLRGARRRSRGRVRGGACHARRHLAHRRRRLLRARGRTRTGCAHHDRRARPAGRGLRRDGGVHAGRRGGRLDRRDRAHHARARARRAHPPPRRGGRSGRCGTRGRRCHRSCGHRAACLDWPCDRLGVPQAQCRGALDRR